MRKNFILCSFLFCIVASAQTTFQKGYFVTKTNQQTECLIKNYDWNRIPTEIEYKTDESAEVKKIYTSQLQSFYIEGTSHMYREYNVPTLPEQKGNLVIKPGKQLLKVIAEGKASLLTNGDDVYFLHFEGQPVKPLIYTRHLSTATGREETDNSFRLELYNSLKCETVGDLRKVKYNEKQLLEVITRYNDCQESETVSYTENGIKADLNFKVMAGINLYKLTVDMSLDMRYRDPINYTFDGEDSKNFVAGFEAEVRLPFNHGKWALFVVPMYNKHEGFQREFSGIIRYPIGNNGFYENFTIGGKVTHPDFSYVEIPIGIRHYFLFNKSSELNLSLSYGASIPLGSKPKIIFEPIPGTQWMEKFDKQGSTLVRIGAGYSYHNYTIDINYYARKSFTESNSNGAISILLGYKIL